MKAKILINRPGAPELEVEVTGVYSAGVRQTREQPGEPATIEEIKATVVEHNYLCDEATGELVKAVVLYHKGEVIELTREEDAKAEEAIWKAMQDNEPDDYPDWYL